MNGVMLSELASDCGGHLEGADCLVNGVSTDTRTIAAGDIYFCLSGDRFDGHDYALQALDKGAIALVVEVAVDTEVTQLVVPDSRKAYGLLARLWRRRMSLVIAGITGSNGKTTVKQLLSQIFDIAGNVHSTRANDNNDIGVPQTLFGLEPDDEYAVVEMGANCPGEIEWLTTIVEPTIAVITNVSASHLEGFGSVADVAREKGAIYSGLPAQGVAVINQHDEYAGYWKSLNNERNILTFGQDASAAVWCERIAANQIRLRCSSTLDNCDSSVIVGDGEGRGEGRIDTEFNLPGDHNLLNAAAAAAIALAAGLSLEQIAAGLKLAEPVSGRLNFHSLLNGSTLIDDTYNANPASTRAAIDVLANSAKVRWLVLGELRELGADAATLHESIGEYARSKSVDRVFAVGDLTRHITEQFGDAGVCYDEHQALCDRLQAELAASGDPLDIAILVKGSRSARMEVVVKYLLANQQVFCAAGENGR